MFETEEAVAVFTDRSCRFGDASTSKGNQIKWHDGGWIIKKDSLGYEGLAEYVCSQFLSYTDVQNYVNYLPCIIHENDEYIGLGCACKNFLSQGERDITFYRLLYSYGHTNCTSYDFDKVRDTVTDIVGFDIHDYLCRCLCFDSIVRNEDRHFNNLSVIRRADGSFREAPIYDNGLSLLADKFTYPMNVDVMSNIKACYAKPFSSDFKRQVMGKFAVPVQFRYDDFFKGVCPKTEEEKRIIDVLHFGLKETEGLSWVRV